MYGSALPPSVPVSLRKEWDFQSNVFYILPFMYKTPFPVPTQYALRRAIAKAKRKKDMGL